jgi:RND family efflux transporter MFP subunit
MSSDQKPTSPDQQVHADPGPQAHIDTGEIKPPSRIALLLTGCAAVALGAVVIVTGVIGRAHSEQALAQWTDDQAVPTVALAKIATGGISEPLTLPGDIQPNYRALIYARVSGYLKNWQSDIGTHVKAGQVLAQIDTPDLDQQLDQAKADLATATANEKLAALTAKRWNALVSSQSVAQQDADERSGDASAKKAQVDAAEANVRRLQALENFKDITAPFDGVVTARNTDIGALINAGSSAGQALFAVSDLHKVRIYVDVPQAFIGRLKPGLTVNFDMPQYPGRQFQATLATTSSSLNETTRTELVELQADNPNGFLTPGTYCVVHFVIPPDPGVLRLPATALVLGDRDVQVATLDQKNQVVLKRIQLGRDNGDTVEVVSGLSPSDRVIDSPPETIVAGEQVRLADGSGPQVAGDSVQNRQETAKAN